MTEQVPAEGALQPGQSLLRESAWVGYQALADCHILLMSVRESAARNRASRRTLARAMATSQRLVEESRRLCLANDREESENVLF